MSWNLEEAVDHYRRQGAPQDQSALVSLLKEVQEEKGGSIPGMVLPAIGERLGVKESFLLAIIRRIPSLRLDQTHLLEVCAGANCGKCAGLAACAEKLASETVTVRFVGCMRLCGKGPNIRWEGTIYQNADVALLKKLVKG